MFYYNLGEVFCAVLLVGSKGLLFYMRTAKALISMYDVRNNLHLSWAHGAFR